MSNKGWAITNTPLVIPQLQAAFDARTIPTGAVASWTDISGFGRHAVQGNASFRPVNTANQRVGNNAVIFDGTNDCLVSTFGASFSQTGTLVVVAKFNNATPGANIIMFDGIVTTARRTLIINNSNLFSVGTNTAVTGGAANANWNIFTFYGGASGVFYINNTSVGSGNMGTNQTTGLTFAARFSVDQAFCDCAMGAVYFYSGTLSSGNITNINRYLGNIWGISVA